MTNATRCFHLRPSTFAVGVLFAIAAAANAHAQAVMAKPADSTRADAAKRADRGDGMIPAGFGTLRQDQIAIRLTAKRPDGQRGAARRERDPHARARFVPFRCARTAKAKKPRSRRCARATVSRACRPGGSRFSIFSKGMLASMHSMCSSTASDKTSARSMRSRSRQGSAMAASRSAGSRARSTAFDPQIDLNQPAGHSPRSASRRRSGAMPQRR